MTFNLSIRTLGLAFFGLTVFAGLSTAQDPAVIDPTKVDSDFAYQGEYVGDVERDGSRGKVGVQIVALGNGRFLGVGYFGGLPGDGWSPAEDPVSSEGEIENGVLRFTTGADTRVKDGVMTVRNDSGNMIGELKKVERKSPTIGLKPPADAVVLFDGTTADNFNNGKLDGNLLIQGVTSKQKFHDFRLHLEFQLSYMPAARGQSRSNSGCYAQGRYEVQILDSFGLKGESKECGGIYEIKKPDMNMCFPPLAWQTYDIEFTAAKFDGTGNKTANAKLTVKHNGVQVHKDVEVPGITRSAPVKEGPEDGPLYLQDHKNPVRFRNIWIVEKK